MGRLLLPGLLIAAVVAVVLLARSESGARGPEVAPAANGQVPGSDTGAERRAEQAPRRPIAGGAQRAADADPAETETGGAQVAGVVLDARGETVPFAVVWLAAAGDGPSEYGRCDENGAFELRSTLPAGRYDVRVDGLRVAEPSLETEIPEGRSRVELVVRIAHDVRTVCGRVVDERGQPISRASVWASPDDGEGVSQADGRFVVLSRRDPGDARVELTAWPGSNEFHLLESPVPCAWGDRDVEIVLRRRAVGALDIVVVAADSGRPVEEYAIRFFRDPVGQSGVWSASWSDVRERGRHQGGRLRLEDVPEDRHLLFVIPEREDLAPTTSLVVDFAPGATGPVRVELQPFVEVPVEVVHADGTPVEGTQVELVRAQDGSRDPEIGIETRAWSPSEMFVRGHGPGIAWRL